MIVHKKTITIRQARADDASTLAYIFLEARQHAFHWQDTTKYALEDFYTQTAGEIIFLAEDAKGKVLALRDHQNFSVSYRMAYEPPGRASHLPVLSADCYLINLI